jgi:cell division septation protein DedD
MGQQRCRNSQRIDSPDFCLVCLPDVRGENCETHRNDNGGNGSPHANAIHERHVSVPTEFNLDTVSNPICRARPIFRSAVDEIDAVRVLSQALSAQALAHDNCSIASQRTQLRSAPATAKARTPKPKTPPPQRWR